MDDSAPALTAHRGAGCPIKPDHRQPSRRTGTECLYLSDLLKKKYDILPFRRCPILPDPRPRVREKMARRVDRAAASGRPGHDVGLRQRPTSSVSATTEDFAGPTPFNPAINRCPLPPIF